MNFRETEGKWQKRWEEARIFEAEPKEGAEKFYLTAAFPYPNSPQHIGHARTYTTTDAYARYMRMRGFNVLFPMGFHVTGTPVLAMAKRVAAKDPEIIEIFRGIYHIPADVIPTLDEPTRMVSYFSREIEAGMREIGFSIDWRRKFYSYDAMFNKFIKWQFEKLKEKGYLVKGSHPVPWCPNEDNAVGAHDTKGDVDPDIDEMVFIKFELDDEPGAFLLCATFRPETIYGVTNVWINPEAEYSLASYDGKNYYVSSEALKALQLQIPGLKAKGRKNGKEFLGKECVNLITGENVPILPASFVDPKVGSGVVMSVPAHAPYDYLAIRDLAGTEWEGKALPPRQVLELEGFGQFPAKEIIERMKVKDQNDPMAEKATEEIYRKEAHTGKMVIQEYEGMRGVDAKEKIKEEMVVAGQALKLYEVINGPIWCRCGAKVCVKLVSDQWFIDYGNEGWKEETRKAFESIKLIPEKTRPEYDYTIGWLKQRACVRAQGLGTRFPYDETKVIESLSDSTIYMAFYTVAHRLKKLDASKLDSAFFDCVMLGKGDAGEVAKKVGATKAEIEGMRREFLYWYPLDSRHSAGDLVHNHLTFFVFNHVAVFPPKLWPKQIATNGFVLMEGSKMSKSLGNILPLREAIRKYGADIVRFSVVSGAELSADSDFNQAMAEGVSSRLAWMMSLIEENAAKKGSGGKKAIDSWLLSKLHRKVKNATQNFETLALREVAQDAFYNSVNELRWYFRRTGGKGNSEVLSDYLGKWVLMMAPFTPHIAEEAWEKLGRKGFVSSAEWPSADEKLIDERVEFAEEIVVKTSEDVENIIKITGKKPVKIHLFVASGWKRKVYSLVREEKRVDTAIKRAMADAELKGKAKDVAKLVPQLAKEVGSLSALVLTPEEELRALSDAAEFLGREFGAEVIVRGEEKAEGEQAKKAANAKPMKPSIFIE